MSSWDDDDFEPDLRGATLGDDTSATPPPGEGGDGDDDAGWFGTSNKGAVQLEHGTRVVVSSGSRV